MECWSKRWKPCLATPINKEVRAVLILVVLVYNQAMFWNREFGLVMIGQLIERGAEDRRVRGSNPPCDDTRNKISVLCLFFVYLGSHEWMQTFYAPTLIANTPSEAMWRDSNLSRCSRILTSCGFQTNTSLRNWSKSPENRKWGCLKQNQFGLTLAGDRTQNRLYTERRA